MLDLLFSSPYEFVLIFGGLILAIGIHEAAHCFMADYLGDPTPRSMGRLTLNPIAHLDPLGTIVMLFTHFGWGKPAPFDPYNLRDPKRDTALIALAGPVSNIILAILFSLFLKTGFLPPTISSVLASLIILNINLAIFNLIPVPPLDGSKIAGLFLSNEGAIKFQYGQNSHLLLFLIILPIFGGVSIASLIVSPISGFIFNLLT